MMSEKEIDKMQGNSNTINETVLKVSFALTKKDGSEHIFSMTRKRFMVLASTCVAVLAVLAGTAGFYSWQYYHMEVDRAAYQNYLDHKEEQEAKLQTLLNDNEKMLRDMSEIHTLETKLRRAVIQNGADKEFTSNIDAAGAVQEAQSTDPVYSGKGGPAVDISMMDVVFEQDKNLAAQIDSQKKKMNELLSIMEGRSNQRSILPDFWPVEGGVISSYYGARINPISGGGDWHPGIDIATDFGTPVYAAAMGTVETAGWKGGYGQYVKINHSNGYESAYGHMSGIAVTPGQQVRKGEIIGFVGSTGYSTGPHLHFEVFVDGQNIDPLYMLKKAK